MIGTTRKKYEVLRQYGEMIIPVFETDNEEDVKQFAEMVSKTCDADASHLGLYYIDSIDSDDLRSFNDFLI